MMSTNAHYKQISIDAPLPDGGVCLISHPTSVDTITPVARQSALGAIRSEMTLKNYDKEAMSRRGEAAGPIAAARILMMVAWVELRAAEAHANRPSETGI
jgi:hypothetical protein